MARDMTACVNIGNNQMKPFLSLTVGQHGFQEQEDGRNGDHGFQSGTKSVSKSLFPGQKDVAEEEHQQTDRDRGPRKM